VVDRVVPVPNGGNLDSRFGCPCAFTYVNGPDFNISGKEYQLDWKPWRGGQLHYAYTDYGTGQKIGLNPQYRNPVPIPPTYIKSLFYMQRLPRGFSASVFEYEIGERIYPGNTRLAAPYSRTDLRFAKAFRLGGSQRAELALTMQNIDGDDPDYDNSTFMQRRVFLTFRIEQ
jgi:hypothetical protein